MAGRITAAKSLRLLTSSSAQTLTANIINTAFGVVTGVATARGMDPSDRGVLVALILWTSTVATFSVLGLDESVVFSSGGNADRSRSLRSGLSRHLRNQVFAGVVVVLVIDLAIARGQANTTLIAAIALALMVPLNAYIQLKFAQLRVEQKFSKWNLLRLIPAGVYSLIAAALAVTSNLTVASGSGALVLGTATTALVARVAIHDSRGAQSSAETVTASRRYGRRLVLANIPYMANQRLDQLLLGLLAAPAVLGVYAVAVSFAALVQIVGTSVEQVLFPRMASGYLDPRRIPRLIAGVVFALCVAIVPLAIFAKRLIELVYGGPYVEAERPLQILLVGTVMVVVSMILTAEAKALGRLTALLRAQLWGMGITAVTLFPAVYYAGLSGAALSSTAAYSFVAVVLWRSRSRSVEPNLSRPNAGEIQ